MPRSLTKGDAARGCAKAIRRVLLQARPPGLHMPQLMKATELTRSQVRVTVSAEARPGRDRLRVREEPCLSQPRHDPDRAS